MSAGVMGDLSDRSDVPCQSTRISQLSNGSCVDMNLVASFKLAADQGDALGQTNYGFCLHNGIGSDESKVK